MTISAYDIQRPVSKALGGVDAPWNETRIKRDRGGRFSSVEQRGAKAAKTVNRNVHQGATQAGGKLDQAGMPGLAQGVEEHPYISLVVAGAVTRFGGKRAMDAYVKGRLIRAAKDVAPVSHVSDNVKPTRLYDVSDQAEGMQDIISNLINRPQDVPEVLARGLQYKATGRNPLPKVKYEGDQVRGANAQARLFGAGERPIKDLDEKLASGGRPYSHNALRMMQGNSADDTLRVVEKRIKGNNHESAFVVVDGELVSGMNGTWMMTGYSVPKGTKIAGKKVTFTHNHPPIMKSQARSFSPGDFNVLEQIVKNGASKNSTLRAVYADGTVQEITITDWGQFQRFNRIMQNSIMGLAQKEGLNATDLQALLHTQARIQEAANSGKYGFKIMEHKDFAKSRLMSDAEIKRRKKAQGHISQATGALGLTALGITGARSKTGQKAIKQGFSTFGRQQPKGLKKKKLGAANTAVLSTGAGIGGAGSFNFAAYTNAESRKRNAVRKAWQPQSRQFNSEKNRERRSTAYPYMAGAAGGAGAALRTGRAIGLRGEAGKVARTKKKGSAARAGDLRALSNRAGKQAVGIAAGGALGAAALQRKKKTDSWATYSKADTTSAFGVGH